MQSKVVTVCGSFRFWEQMLRAAEQMALEQGCVVLTPTPHVLDTPLTDEQIATLGALHRQRIDMSDAILVVNPDGYIGDAVKGEIAYAKERGKEILYLEN
jgi:hypothetical protein